MRASTSVHQRERRIFSCDKFGGVDFTTPPQNIKNHQAQYMENFVVEGGQLKKRNGWKELINLPGRINGIFKYADYLLIHAGEKLYRYTGSTYEAVSGEYALADQKSQAFENDGKLYIIAGKLYVFDGTSVRNMNCDDAYVPTTTISIDDTGVSDPARASNEDINLLTPYRKNGLTGRNNLISSDSEGDGDGSWQPDFGITPSYFSLTFMLDAEVEEIVSVKVLSISDENKEWKELEADDYYVHGRYITITNNIPLNPPIKDEDNIEVTFKANGQGTPLLDEIITCGATFGMEERSDRLFLASDNKEYFSASGDFSYFPASNIAAIGDSSPITGFGRLSDGTFCIYKKGKIYYQTKSVYSRADENGDIAAYKESFPISEGASGCGCENPFLSNNLSSDTLVANADGVFGIVIKDGVLRTQRNTAERSYPISKKLKEYRMEDAYSCVHDGKYYLSFGGDCFVADARRRYRVEESLDSSYSYEWYYFTNIPARVMASINGKLYFGTCYEKEGGTYGGKLCVFDTKHSDREYYLSDPDEVGVQSLGDEDEYLVFYEKLPKLAQSATLIETTLDAYWELAREISIRNSRLYLPEGAEEVISMLYDDMPLWIDVGEGDPFGADVFSVRDIDIGSFSFALYSGEERVSFEDREGVRAMIYTDGTYYELKFDGNGYKRNYFGRLLKLVQCNEETPRVRLSTVKGVHAKWLSPVWALSSDIYLKTLLSITISAESSSGEELTVGYETRKSYSEFKDRGTSKLDFADLTFESFSFESDFAKSYTKRVLERNFNYILLKIESDGTSPCSINSLTLKYKINKYTKGVK